MEPENLPRAVIRSFDISRGQVHLRAGLVMVFDDRIRSMGELAMTLLGPTEKDYFLTLRSEKRQKSYLLGRYAAKLALKDLLSEPDLRSIEIVKGVFEQPIVQCKSQAGWGVSIGHTGLLAAGLAFPIGHPMGIDIERIDPTRQETIFSQLSSQEVEWIEQTGPDRDRVATAFWAAKEALSKVLTTGLMTPLQIYNLTEFSRIDSGVWEGRYQNFAQYKVRVWTGSTYVLAITLPQRSMMEQAGDLCAALSEKT